MTKPQIPNAMPVAEVVKNNIWAILLGGLAFYQTFIGYGHRITMVEDTLAERRSVVAQAAVLDARISFLEKATEDRFTGKEGDGLTRRIERLERRIGVRSDD